MAFYAGEYYHIYNRGLNRDRIFFSEENYIYCLRLIKEYAIAMNISVIVYCLMPNHYHLLMRQNAEIPISKLIQNVFNRYVQAVNLRLGRKGTLFEGKYRHVHVNRHEYILHLCRYIHLNPVAAGLVRHPGDWPYSNYPDWIGCRNGTLKDDSFIREYFTQPELYETFVLEYQEEKEIMQRLTQYTLD